MVFRLFSELYQKKAIKVNIDYILLYKDVFLSAYGDTVLYGIFGVSIYVFDN